MLQRSVNRFQPQPNRDGEVIKLLLELAHGRPEQGFPKLFKRLRRLGHKWNHKRVYRVYCGLKLNKRRKGKRRRGYPLKLRLDNGPELVSVTLADWSEQHGVTLEFIKPGKPMQNDFIERFNRTYREAVLDMFVFQSLDEVREQTEKWLKEYNEERPHDALGDLTPREYLLTQKPEISTNSWS